MKRVHTAVIGPTSYEILLVEEGDREELTELTEGDTHYRGRVSHKEEKIFIDNTMKREQIIETIIHELIHSLSAVYSLHLKEKQVSVMSVGLTMMLRDNEWLRELCSPEKEEHK